MRLLCDLNAIDINSDNASSLLVEDYLIVCTGDKLHVYQNSCPHRRKPLNLISEKLLDEQKNFIRCEHHQALFTISQGLCISGPCTGGQLREIDFKVFDGKLYITEEKLMDDK